ncbi:MAG TPA: tetratricopeptide repeat protein [Solirubrobacteraceae bacterium]|nr:tetratricopeptide repeat protein [Solirubrobacteraceae bacterium]
MDRLPTYLTRLVGRQEELTEMLALLPSVKLLTLTGPGGSGKTRLALALAERAGAESGVATWWVDLTDVSDEQLVGEHVLHAVGGGELPARPTAETIATTLRDSSLLVLDNCEQVADGCAQLIGSVLSMCPELTVIATSRQPLGVAGEQQFRVTGLPVAEDTEGAVQLFAERARRLDPRLSTDEMTMSAIREICQRLDGMPLAIELAASRTRLLGVPELSERLRQDPRVLKDQSRELPDRHQSIEATLEWSHLLLAPREQTVFRRLAAFRGSFNLDAAEMVCTGDGVEGIDFLDALGELINQSLVEVAQGDAENRYRLLLPVRAFALARLERSGEAEAVRDRHARWFARLIAEAEPGLPGPEQFRWLERLDAEHDNFRAALETSLAGNPETAGELAAPLWQFWYRRGYYHEARRWLEDAVAVTDRMSPAMRARVLTSAASFDHLHCEYALASDRLERALPLYEQLGDDAGAATVLQRLGSVAREQARYAQAIELHKRSLALWRELGDQEGIADSLHFLGFASWLGADLERAQQFTAEALERYRALGELQEVAAVTVNLGAIAHYQGDDQRAVALLDEALDLARRCESQEGIAWALHERGVVAAHVHDLTQATGLFLEALGLHRRLGDQWRTARLVEDIAGALLAPIEPVLAGQLLAAAESARERLEAPVPLAERPAHERYLRAFRRGISASELEAIRSVGREKSLDEAADDAIEAARRLYLGPHPRDPLMSLLTPREHAVLKLVSEGHTNREIGVVLSISTSTVGVHVSNVMRKLKVTRRAQAVARARELGL